MSKYTTEVRTICENLIGLKSPAGYGCVNDILSKAAPLVFNFDWPIFDEAYRRVLEIKILKHFYTREIGLETVGLWKLKLDTKMNEIMPYYNQLYKSELLEFNPLYDTDIIRQHKKDSEGTRDTDGGNNNTSDINRTKNGEISRTETENNTAEVNGNGKNTDKYSDTPQGSITDLEAGKYLTNARIVDTIEGENSTGNRNTNGTDTSEDTETDKIENEGTNYSNTTISDTENYVENVMGKTGQGSYSKMLQEFRQTFLNIDMMIIEDLEPLFMQLW